MSLSKTLTTTLALILLAIAPFFFLPIFPNIYLYPKIILIVGFALVMLVIYLSSITLAQTLTIKKNNLNLPIILITAALLVNLLLPREAQTESFYTKGLVFLGLVVISWLITQLSSLKLLSRLITPVLVTTTSILSLLTIIHLTFLYKQTFIPDFMQSRAFTPTGSLLHTTLILLVGLVAALASLRTNKNKFTYAFASGLILIGLAASASLLVGNGELAIKLFPYSASWSLILDNAKSLPSLLFGVGLSNFSAFYTSVKPLFINSTFFWNINPEVGSSELFTLLITGGLLLTLSLMSYVAASLKNLSDKDKLPINLAFITTTLCLVLLPGSIILYLYFFLLGAALSSTTNKTSFDIKPLFARLGFVILAIIIGIATIFYVGKAALAEHSLYLAQLGIVQNDAKKVYDQTLKAVTLMPKMTGYRLAYSQLNLNLASSLSQSENGQDEKVIKDITQLVSIAVREAQAASSLRPSLATTWQNLGTIYRNLIGVAEGSENYAAEYLGTAVAKDPGNPALRIEYGGLFYQLSDSKIATDAAIKSNLLSRAIEQFQVAVNLKGDYANAYYNLSKAYQAIGNKKLAIELLKNTLSLLDPGSTDYQTASQELKNLEESKDQENNGTEESRLEVEEPSELTSPEPLPTPLPSPIEVPPNTENTEEPLPNIDLQ